MMSAGSYSAPQSPTNSLARTAGGGWRSRSATDIAAIAAAAEALAEAQQLKQQLLIEQQQSAAAAAAAAVASVQLTTRVYTRIVKRFSPNRRIGAATVLPYEGSAADAFDTAANAVVAFDSSSEQGRTAASGSSSQQQQQQQQQQLRPSLKGTVQLLLQEQRVVRSFYPSTSSLSYVAEERTKHSADGGESWAAETYDSALESV
jgi:hypothetical protein